MRGIIGGQEEYFHQFILQLLIVEVVLILILPIILLVALIISVFLVVRRDIFHHYGSLVLIQVVFLTLVLPIMLMAWYAWWLRTIDSTTIFARVTDLSIGGSYGSNNESYGIH